MSKKSAQRQAAAAGAARTDKGTAEAIAASDANAEAKAVERKAAAKARRAARREAYPVVSLTVKLHKAAQSRDVIDSMMTAANAWAESHKYVLSTGDPTTHKSGAVSSELVIDTPESFAAKSRVKGDPDKTREVAKAVATALRSDAVRAKATEMGVAPKDLVLTALQSQFGITIEL